MTPNTETSEMVGLRAELAQARETNRKLHRRAQRAEGVVQVLNDTLALWESPPHRGGYGNYRFGYSVAVRFVKHYVEARLKRNAGKPTLDAAEQRASSERNKALEEAAAIAAEQEEDGTYVWADGFEIADAIRALQNGGGDA